MNTTDDVKALKREIRRLRAALRQAHEPAMTLKGYPTQESQAVQLFCFTALRGAPKKVPKKAAKKAPKRAPRERFPAPGCLKSAIAQKLGALDFDKDLSVPSVDGVSYAQWSIGWRRRQHEVEGADRPA